MINIFRDEYFRHRIISALNIFIAPIYLPDHLYPTNVSGKTKIIYIILGKTGKNRDIKSERKGKEKGKKKEK